MNALVTYSLESPVGILPSGWSLMRAGRQPPPSAWWSTTYICFSAALGNVRWLRGIWPPSQKSRVIFQNLYMKYLALADGSRELTKSSPAALKAKWGLFSLPRLMVLGCLVWYPWSHSQPQSLWKVETRKEAEELSHFHEYFSKQVGFTTNKEISLVVTLCRCGS